ncbi:hypothetical protein N8T08_002938 [Aspergillus melleus]|uniref:Uncharacterized protein n=1 Tax=Aspergillus melleus TaxID=138277 RepID=A0ACC3B856_9EURO|nr:hypothetical protein N8T08_002938 [Aspergillus melleus]
MNQNLAMFMHKYRPVESEESSRDQEVFKLDNECSTPETPPQKLFYKRCTSVQYILIVLLVLTNLATLVFWSNASTTQKSKAPATTLEQDVARNDILAIQTLGPADIPVEMEMREFSTGITGDRETEFFGEPDEKTNAAWDSLMDGGISYSHKSYDYQ